jgi:alpha-glucosidase
MGGMWLNRDGGGQLDRCHPGCPAFRVPMAMAWSIEIPARLAWRTLFVARQPGQLIESDLVLNLASPTKLADASWIKPGIASWDWWSQVTRPSTATFKELIQFSADMGWPYVLLDAGWSNRTNILQATWRDHGGITGLRERTERVWLWLHWTSVITTTPSPGVPL